MLYWDMLTFVSLLSIAAFATVAELSGYIENDRDHEALILALTLTQIWFRVVE